jgi:hypothetical protein
LPSTNAMYGHHSPARFGVAGHRTSTETKRESL